MPNWFAKILAVISITAACSTIELSAITFAALLRHVAAWLWLHWTVLTSYYLPACCLLCFLVLNDLMVTCLSPAFIHCLKHELSVSYFILKVLSLLSHLYDSLWILTSYHHVVHESLVLVRGCNGVGVAGPTLIQILHIYCQWYISTATYIIPKIHSLNNIFQLLL